MINQNGKHQDLFGVRESVISHNGVNGNGKANLSTLEVQEQLPLSEPVSNGFPESDPSLPPPPEKPRSNVWQRVRQGWNNLSFRTKLIILLVGGAAVPVLIVTQGIVGIAEQRLLSSMEETLKKELTLLDEGVRNVQESNRLVAGNMAQQITNAGIDINNPSEVATRRGFIQSVASDPADDAIGQSFHILTDAQGRTVAQTIEILSGDLSGYPPLPSSETEAFTEPSYRPLALPPGIYMGDIDIVRNALTTGRSLAGVELVKSTPLQRLGLAQQANIGIRKQVTEGLPEEQQPFPVDKYDIDNGKAGLVVMAVEPIRVNGRRVGTAIVGTLLNRNYLLPDYMKAKTDVSTATIFAKDWRVTTNVPYTDNQTRAIGARVSREVAEVVLEQKQTFLGKANIIGNNYLTAYGPLYDHQKQINPAGAKPIGMTYVGEPQSAVQETLQNLQLAGYGLGGGILLLAGLVAVPIAGSFSRPLRRLTNFAQAVAEGEEGVRLEATDRQDEIGVLSEELNQMADSIEANLSAVRQQEERSRLFAEISAKIRESLNLEDILVTAVGESRQALNSDRVVVYRFNTNWNGKVIAESVGSGWVRTLGTELEDTCLREGHGGMYKEGRVRAIDNIYQAGLTDCHIKLLERFEVKANLVVPIIVNSQLFGLMIAHQCSGYRTWHPLQIELFTQVATQVGIALNQALLLEQVEQARQEAEQLAQEQRQQKEAIQYQLIELLSEVEGATRGDLTVRADVTAGDIGTVADFFNAIVESLRQIVMQVKQTATQVNLSVGNNESAVRQLTYEALEQVQEITEALNSVEIMSLSIQEVATNASQAAEVARSASLTAQDGGKAMDRTVESILSLRETVAETAKKVKRLGEASQQISKVVSLINQIALQTNLLAINASIEAARAGEEGRGFAVVAEEVGALAAQSAAATKEIEQIVENIQKETSEVARAMELGTSQVVEGTTLVAEAKTSLGQILEVSQQIDQLVQSISDSTVSQSQMSESITQLMQEIAGISQRTSDSSREVSASLQETVEVAKQLQASVGTFNVGDDS